MSGSIVYRAPRAHSCTEEANKVMVGTAALGALANGSIFKCGCGRYVRLYGWRDDGRYHWQWDRIGKRKAGRLIRRKRGYRV